MIANRNEAYYEYCIKKEIIGNRSCINIRIIWKYCIGAKIWNAVKLKDIVDTKNKGYEAGREIKNQATNTIKVQVTGSNWINLATNFLGCIL